MCVPSPVRVLTWHVRALTWHVRALTWHVRALTCACLHLCAPLLGMCAPSPGMCAPSLGMCTPSPSAPLQKVNVGVQLPPLSVRIVVFLPSASLWDSWVRPHLACAGPRLAYARPHLACPSPLRLTLSKKQCRCPTTPVIRAYYCLFAFRYLVG